VERYASPTRIRGLPRWPDAGLASATFDDFDPTLVDGGESALVALRRWASKSVDALNDSVAMHPRSGVVLVGSTGTGKTHLLTATARIIAANVAFGTSRRRVVLVSELHLREFVRASWRRGEPLDPRVPRLLSGDIFSVLLYDDLGAVGDDERFAVEVRDLLALRHASASRTLTAITTNLDLGEIEDRYGARFSSRLRESVLAYPLDGVDRRRARRG